MDVSTGEFYVAQGKFNYIEKLLQSFAPNEVIVEKSKLPLFKTTFGDKFFCSTFEDWVFTPDFAYELLLKHFQVSSFKGFGVEELPMGLIAAGACMHYLFETQHDKVSHITKLSRLEENKYVWLDKFTIRNLELMDTPNEKAITLLDVIDHTISPMGARMLKKWMLLPLKDKTAIERRLHIVQFLIDNASFSSRLNTYISQVGDLERLISKVSVSRANPKELLQVKRALYAIEEIKHLTDSIEDTHLQSIGEQLNTAVALRNRIEDTIADDAPMNLLKGGVIKNGVDAQLDELRYIATSGKDYLLDMQRQETERTGISSLKVGYNNVFGYYLEVTNAHKDKVPPEWIRKQTLTNAERYMSKRHYCRIQSGFQCGSVSGKR